MKKMRKFLCLAGIALAAVALVACSGKKELQLVLNHQQNYLVRLQCGTPLLKDPV